MKAFTLEWNAVISLDEGRSKSAAIKELVALHRRQIIDLGIVTTAASENTKLRLLPATARDFDNRLAEVGLDDLTKVNTICVVDLTYIGYCAVASEQSEEVISQLWKIVKPVGIPRSWRDFASSRAISDNIPISAPNFQKWRNKWCDVHSIYAHIQSGRDVFVSNDVKNFKGDKAEALRDLGVSKICSYEEALELARVK